MVMSKFEHLKNKQIYALRDVQQVKYRVLRRTKEEAQRLAYEASSFFSDRDIKTILLWAIISPAAALAYITWVRYPRLRPLVFPLIVISALQLASQWGGFAWVLERLGIKI